MVFALNIAPAVISEASEEISKALCHCVSFSNWYYVFLWVIIWICSLCMYAKQECPHSNVWVANDSQCGIKIGEMNITPSISYKKIVSCHWDDFWVTVTESQTAERNLYYRIPELRAWPHSYTWLHNSWMNIIHDLHVIFKYNMQILLSCIHAWDVRKCL